MKTNPFHPGLQDLPTTLPIFPLVGVVLLPRAQLPLNVFEPRYLNLTLDALGAGRLIGMIQPDPSSAGEAVCRVGCAGRITAFSESDDGRLLIVLTGVCRFAVAGELPPHRGYRRVAPRWAPFAADLEAPSAVAAVAPAFLDAVRRYAVEKGLELDLDDLARLPAEGLVDALTMNLPLEPREKQSLLEAPTLDLRADLLQTLLDLAAPAPGSAAIVRH